MRPYTDIGLPSIRLYQFLFSLLQYALMLLTSKNVIDLTLNVSPRF